MQLFLFFVLFWLVAEIRKFLKIWTKIKSSINVFLYFQSKNKLKSF